MHGGPSSWHITCVYELKTVGAGDGGFGCCPGSHTAEGQGRLRNMPGVGDPAFRTQWLDTRWSKKHPKWDPAVRVHRVEGTAGSCILFTCVRVLATGRKDSSYCQQ